MDAVASIFSIGSYVGQYIILGYLALLAYRLFLHPLRRYPGPVLAKMSDIYSGFYAGAMRLHLAVLQNHNKYGPVVRVGPNKLLFNSAAALQDIYNNVQLQKSYVYTLLPNATTYPNVFNVIDKRLHQHKRKLLGQAVSDRAMRLFEPTMIEHIDLFIAMLSSSCKQTAESRVVNMTTLCKRLGIDLVGLLAFGFGLNTQTEETYRFLIPGLVAGNFRANLYLQFPFLKKLQLDYIITFLSRRQRARYYALVHSMLQERLSKDVHARTDLVSFLAEGSDTDAVEDRSQLEEILRWESILFVSAGSDTISSALCAVFFYLSRNSEAYSILASEIRGAFASSADVRMGPTLAGCTYLRACIDEALRMSPPVTGALWRERSAHYDSQSPLVVDGHVVPPGTQVGVSIYSLHHNTDYFPEPFRFQPERWLTEDQDTLKKLNAAFVPFSLGSRMCVGKPMAYLEASLVVAKTIWHFDFEVAPGTLGEVGAGIPGRKDGRGRPGEYQLYDVFAATHDGPNLVFRAREEK